MDVRCGWVSGVGIPGGYPGGYTGGLYRVPSQLLEETPRQRSGPRSPPAGGRSGWSGGRTYRGPENVLYLRYFEVAEHARTHPFGARSVTLQVPSLVLPAAIGRDSTSFLRNLVKTAECHPKYVKRPVIVPVSKTEVKSHLLKFSDFRFY